MSTSKLNTGLLVKFIKTVTNHYDHYFGREDKQERAYGDFLHKFIMSTNQVLAPNDNAEIVDPQKLLVGFVDKALDLNKRCLDIRYPDMAEDNAAYFKRELDNLADLVRTDEAVEKLAFPANPKALLGLLASVNKINHGYDDLEQAQDGDNEFIAGVRDFYYNLPTHAVMMSTNMPKDLPESTSLFQHVLSVWTWGDKYFERQEACRSMAARLESRDYFASEIFTDLLSQYLEGDKKSVTTVSYATEAWKVRLPSMSSKTGLSIRVTGDIPQPTDESPWIMLKAVNEMVQCFSSLGEHAISNYDDSIESNEYKAEFTENLRGIAMSMNMAFAESQDIYKKAFREEYKALDDMSYGN